MIDFNKYIKIPWKHLGRDEHGIDCYGLARLMYKKEINVNLPDYIYPIYKEYQVDFNKEQFPVMDILDKINPPCQELDLLWLQIPWLKTVNHVGIYIGNGLILEAHDPAGVICSEYLKRIACINGIYRLNINKYKEIYG